MLSICYSQRVQGVTNAKQFARDGLTVPKRILRKRNYTIQIGLMITDLQNKKLLELSLKDNCSIQELIRGFIDLGLQKEKN